MVTHSSATMNSSKTLFSSNNIGYPLSLTNKRNHLRPTHARQGTPPPQCRNNCQKGRKSPFLSSKDSACVWQRCQTHISKCTLMRRRRPFSSATRGFTRKARPPICCNGTQAHMCRNIYDAPSLCGHILLMQPNETLYESLFCVLNG
ncbi:hypothetical protein CEXT_360071, partial [Caerostris extrusa]